VESENDKLKSQIKKLPKNENMTKNIDKLKLKIGQQNCVIHD